MEKEAPEETGKLSFKGARPGMERRKTLGAEAVELVPNTTTEGSKGSESKGLRTNKEKNS